MNRLLFILVGLSLFFLNGFFSFAEEKPVYSCQSISEVDIQDYSFDVIPIKKGKVKRIDPLEKLDLSVYRGKVVLLTIFSPLCSYCGYDLLYHTRFQKEVWPEGEVVMVNLSFGSDQTKDMLDFVTGGWKDSIYGTKISLEWVDFYHIFTPPEEGKTAFNIIKTFSDSENQRLLFPGLRGTPYTILIDKKGDILFRGHWTVGEDATSLLYDKHYAFISSLVSGSCVVKN